MTKHDHRFYLLSPNLQDTETAHGQDCRENAGTRNHESCLIESLREGADPTSQEDRSLTKHTLVKGI